MEDITFLIKPKSEILDSINAIFVSKYAVSESERKESLNKLDTFFNSLSDELWAVIEYPYVDKTYRDSYYGYYASKRFEYSRNTIKLSLFSTAIEPSSFRDKTEIQILEKSYQGFLVVRPTFPKVIGRNVIDKRILKNPNFVACSVNYSSTANGVKFIANGFPHCSQDSETITCAETTIWSIMEYFGYKYAEYSPASPLKITQMLSKFSYERLLPSKGLTPEQMSFALKELGFGVRIYSKKQYEAEFDRILKTYVESGIPLIAVMKNDYVGHAITIIGRKLPSPTDYVKLNPSDHIIGKNLEIKDFSDLDLELILMDDNHPPYQVAKIDAPSSYYTDKKWEECKITNIIVPLYSKIYLEAGEARKISSSFIKNSPRVKDKELIYKTFLTSSRSFKNEIAFNNSLASTSKDLLLATSMPKFIWVTELYDNELAKSDLVAGMIIIDATELKSSGIIAVILENVYLASRNNSVQAISIDTKPFLRYQNNLR